MSIKSVVTIGVFAGLLLGGSALAETTWAPPTEIAPKAAPSAAPAAGEPAAAKPAEPAEAKKDKEKECKDKADAQGLHGKARKKFNADCLKS